MFIPSGCIMAWLPEKAAPGPWQGGWIRCGLDALEDAAVSSPPGLHLPFPSSDLKQGLHLLSSKPK